MCVCGREREIHIPLANCFTTYQTEAFRGGRRPGRRPSGPWTLSNVLFLFCSFFSVCFLFVCLFVPVWSVHSAYLQTLQLPYRRELDVYVVSALIQEAEEWQVFKPGVGVSCKATCGSLSQVSPGEPRCEWLLSYIFELRCR